MIEKENYYVPKGLGESRIDCVCNNNLLKQKYHFKSKIDLDNNSIIFTAGYNDTDEYDSIFDLDIDNANKLLKLIENSINYYNEMDILLKKATKFIDDLNSNMEEGNITRIDIECIDVADNIPGSIILKVSYDKDYATLVSENILTNDIEKFLNKVKSKYPDIDITFNSDKYHQLKKIVLDDMKLYNSNRFNAPKEIEKEDINKIAESILQKIDTKYKK